MSIENDDLFIYELNNLVRIIVAEGGGSIEMTKDGRWFIKTEEVRYEIPFTYEGIPYGADLRKAGDVILRNLKR